MITLFHQYVSNKNVWIPVVGENKTYFVDKSRNSRCASMDMHNLSRVNIALIKSGLKYKKDNYLELAYQSALNAIQIHNVKFHSDETTTLNYMYNSSDCTLNVNSEFAQWLSMFPEQYQNDTFCKIVNGITRLLINEQREDGSWGYFSEDHIRKWNGKNNPDCHHTATVISNLLFVLKGNSLLKDNVRNDLINVINKGVNYFINTFWNIANGEGITFYGYNRPAGPVQYAESIFAFIEYIDGDFEKDQEVCEKIKKLLPLMIKHLENFIDKNGNVPSEKVLLWVNVKSIRWGNGPVLQALAWYYKYNMRNNDA